MAYTSANLANLVGAAPGNGVYFYDGGSDTMATVAAAGYFDNDNNLLFAVDDLIFCQCSDGDIWIRVGSISSGAVTANVVSGEGPWNGVIGASVGTVTVPGITEIGTGTATAHTMSAAPFIGARVVVTQMGTATGGITVVTSSVGVSVNPQGNRTISFTGQGQSVTLLGVSTTRWVVTAANGVTFAA